MAGSAPGFEVGAPWRCILSSSMGDEWRQAVHEGVVGRGGKAAERMW
jgi:hypothetical protein